MKSPSQKQLNEGMRLREWRRRNGLTQEQLGGLAGKASKQQVWAWETGREHIPEYARNALLAERNVCLDYQANRHHKYEAAWHPNFDHDGNRPRSLEREVLTVMQGGGYRWRFAVQSAFKRSDGIEAGATEAALTIRRVLGCGSRSPLPDLAVALQRAGVRLLKHPHEKLKDRLVAISSLSTVCIAGNFTPCEGDYAVTERRVSLLSVLAELELKSLPALSKEKLCLAVEKIAAKALLPDAALNGLTPRSPPEKIRIAAQFYGAPVRLLLLRLAENFETFDPAKFTNSAHSVFQRESEILPYP